MLFETEHYRKNGSAYPAEVYLQYICEGDGAFFLGVVLDATEKRQWEKALEESEERYRRLTEQALDIIYRIELIPERRFVYINPAVERITGYTPEEHYRDPDLGLKIVIEEDRPLLEAALKSDDIFSRPLRVRWKTKKQQIIWTEQHNVPLYDSEGKLIAIEGIARDVTDRMEMLEDLNNEKKRLEVTLFSIGDAVIAADQQGRITLINPVAEHLLGVLRKDVLGSPVDDYVIIVDAETLEPVTNPVTDVIQTRKAVELRSPCCLIDSEGEQKLIESGAYPIKNEDGLLTGVVMIFRDISQKWAIQEHLIKTQRLESLGLLAARIAHDFNNLLSGLFGYVEIAAGAVRQGDGDKGLAYLEKAAGVYSRMKGLTGKFLTFSKGGGPVREKGDLSLLIREVLKSSLEEKNVSVEFRVDSDLQPCDFDEGQIRQMLTNIVLNAVEAMKGKGQLKVEGSNLSVVADSPLPLTPGPYIAVRISDNGEGIPSHYIKKIFDPFFTTKKNGSGLGLATGYSVVRQHGGDIQAESVLGEGTAVTVYLPASFGPVEKKNTDQEALFCGRGRALVLDDEEFVREVTAEMLQNLGFVVDEAEEGGRALRMIKAAAEKADPYSLIIADLTIPSGRGGKEIIDEVRIVDPDVVVVVSTGYSDDPVLNHPHNYGFSAGLHKPFTTEELSRALKAVFLQEDGS